MATVFEKLNKLNLIGNFISNFLANLSFGYIYNAVVGEINPKFFALTTAASCLSSLRTQRALAVGVSAWLVVQ